MNYTQTLETLSYFFADCAKFWKYDIEKAIKDVENVKRDPFSPRGKKLDKQAKADFIAYLHEAKQRLN